MRLQLQRGRFLRRYKRFFADVELDSGETVVSHCPNTGSMRTLLSEGAEAWVRFHDDPRRKLAWTLTFLGVRRRKLALVDTMLPNRVVADGIAAGRVAELGGYAGLRREVKFGERSRVDIVLEDPVDAGRAGSCYVEVKNCTMLSDVDPGRCDFPDSVTERGLRHLRELTSLAGQGTRVVQFYLLGRTDCDSIGVATGIDPAYGDAVTVALDAGVEFLAYEARIRRNGVSLGRRVPFIAP